MSKIEQTIDEMEEYISGCKQVPLSNTRIYVNRDDMEELIRKLRLKVPEEIRSCRKMISNRDSILSDAKEKAENMIREAQLQMDELVKEHEIMQRAYEQANQVIEAASAEAQKIVDRAVEEANEIRMGAIQYTDDSLVSLQRIIEHSLENSKLKYENLINELTKDLNIIIANREELKPEDTETEVAAEQELAANVKELMDDDGPTDEE